jgi:hypothetical protein
LGFVQVIQYRTSKIDEMRRVGVGDGNSKSPRTQEMSARMMGLADGPPTFYNLEVLDDRIFS